MYLGLDSTFEKGTSWYLVPSFHGKQMGKKWKQCQISFGAPKSLWTVTVAMELKDTCSLEEKLWQRVKKLRHHFADKHLCGQSYGFSSSHVWMLELDYKESWALKNWCFWTVVFEKTLESPLDCKEIQPVHPKGNQSWIFTGRTDVEAETPILWPPDEKNWQEKTLMLGKTEGRIGKGDDRGWFGWMASPTRWTWLWAGSGNWWWTRRPGVLQSMESQRVRHDWVTELNWE